VRLEGESEALKDFGVGPGAGVTLKEFYEISEFKRTLDYYIPHVVNALRHVAEKRVDLWRIPPVRVTRHGNPKTLVPAYFELGQDNAYTFEFLVYEPLPDYILTRDSAYSNLFNLFVLTWQFRCRIIEMWLERLLDLASLGQAARKEEVQRQIRKFKLDFTSIPLEGLNRGLDSPRKVLLQFPKKEDQELLGKILDLDRGIYVHQMVLLETAIKENDLSGIVASLKEMKKANKTLLVMTLKRLSEVASEMDGELIAG
jgi:hypothetical protein